MKRILTGKRLPKVDPVTKWSITGPHIERKQNGLKVTYIYLTDENGKQHKRGYIKYMKNLGNAAYAIKKIEVKETLFKKLVKWVMKLSGK